jgi:hypothetical protein
MVRSTGLNAFLMLIFFHLGRSTAAQAPARSYIDCLNDFGGAQPAQTSYRDFVDGKPTRYADEYSFTAA